MMIFATADQSRTDYVHRLQQPDRWVVPVALPPLPPIQAKSRYAVVTLGTGDRGRELLDISRPSIQAYAGRVGADYHEITGEPTVPSFVFWDKFRTEQYFHHYERIVYIDADIVVRPTAPNLFNLVPENSVAVHNETPYMGLAFAWIYQEYEWLCRSQGYAQTIPAAMYNTGFWVASRQHRAAFQAMERPFNLTHCAEQVHISMRLHQLGFPIWPMTRELHWQHWNDKSMKLFPKGQFLHFSGITDHEKRKRLMTIAAGTVPTRAAKMSAAPAPEQLAVAPEPEPKKKGCGCKDKPASRPTQRRINPSAISSNPAQSISSTVGP